MSAILTIMPCENYSSDVYGAEMDSTIARAIGNGQSISMTVETGEGEIYRTFLPVNVTGNGQYWELGVDIPME